MNELHRQPGLCYVSTGAGVAVDLRPAGCGQPSPTFTRQDHSRAPEVGAAPRHLPQVPAPPLCVTSATSRPGLGRGVCGGARSEGSPPAAERGLHFPRGLAGGGGGGGGRGNVPRKWSPGLPLVREASGAGDETRGRTRDLTRWPGCPAGLSR